MAHLDALGERSSKRSETGVRPISLNGFYRQHRERLITLGLVIGFLSIWEILARLGKISPIIFPAPSIILHTFVFGFVHGLYTKDLLITMSRVFSGFVIGGGVGLILGLIMGWSRTTRKILDPIVAALHPVPKFALLPMILIIFGLGEMSRTVMVSIAAFFPMLVSTVTGVVQINPTYYEVVENYGASNLDVFRKVVFPGSLPYVMTGARLALKSALTITIGVEMVFGNSGLGSILWLAWETMRLTYMYSVILIVCIIGVGSVLLLEKSKKTLLPWHQENRPS
jgi:ABC-type nitrate/sulfonate/bicarbonate transport system permease component